MNPTSALHEYILNAPLVDTHEHLLTQKEFEGRQDILGMLVGHYWGDDLLSADLSIPRVNNWLRSWSIDWEHPSLDGQKNSLAERFHVLKKGIERSLHTSNGKAASRTMRKVFGQEEVDLASLEAAQVKLDSDHASKSRLELLRDVAGIDHVQADHWFLNIEPDAEDTEFFLYDLSVHPYTNLPFAGRLEDIVSSGGPEFSDFDSLNQGLESVFEENAARAIAVKTAHAYTRTLEWSARSESEARAAFDRMWRHPQAATLEDQLCLSDWNLGRIAELASKHNLPVKIHTGFYGGSGHMRTDYIRPGHLSEFLITYPNTRFVLMHIGYPYEHEMIAMTKHFPNVWVDLCWAWSIDELATRNFVRRFLNAVPYNKLFVFGGDTGSPYSVNGYAMQAREGLSETLQECVCSGDFNTPVALEIAEHLMLKNAYECFDLTATRSALRDRAESQSNRIV